MIRSCRRSTGRDLTSSAGVIVSASVVKPARSEKNTVISRVSPELRVCPDGSTGARGRAARSARTARRPPFMLLERDVHPLDLAEHRRFALSPSSTGTRRPSPSPRRAPRAARDAPASTHGHADGDRHHERARSTAKSPRAAQRRREIRLGREHPTTATAARGGRRAAPEVRVPSRIDSTSAAVAAPRGEHRARRRIRQPRAMHERRSVARRSPSPATTGAIGCASTTPSSA